VITGKEHSKERQELSLRGEANNLGSETEGKGVANILMSSISVDNAA